LLLEVVAVAHSTLAAVARVVSEQTSLVQLLVAVLLPSQQ
jgi:hypothetical protein|tara:strand:+ start:546 stop:665 length:120 start_codon:yes stop_codon:yes gene_type:complete